MGKYTGLFMGGMASGISQGMQWGQQLAEMKWQSAQKKELKKKAEETQTSILNINKKLQEYGADSIWSNEEYADFNALIMAGGTEIQSLYKQAQEDIRNGRKEEYNRDMELIKLWDETIDGLSPDNIQASYDAISKLVTNQDAKRYFDANANLKKRQAENKQEQPEDQQNQPQDIEANVTAEANVGAGVNAKVGGKWDEFYQNAKNKNIPEVSTDVDYTTLSEKELYGQIQASDPTSEEYAVLYEEAKRRGLVK